MASLRTGLSQVIEWDATKTMTSPRAVLAGRRAGSSPRGRPICGSRSVAFTTVRQYYSKVSQLPTRPSITRATKLSEVRRLLNGRKPTEGRARMVRSIQQSMRVEGYEASTEVVANAVDKVFRSRRTG